jgi:hypothetical protein
MVVEIKIKRKVQNKLGKLSLLIQAMFIELIFIKRYYA